MSALGGVLADYLALRRAVGFSLAGQDRLLGDFVDTVEKAGEAHITTRRALAWSSQARSRREQARRLGVVRVFARYAQSVDPATEVPSTRLLAGVPRRPAPCLFSEADVLAVIDATRTIEPEWWGWTIATVIGLLWATGLRTGEARRLGPADVSFADALVTVWRSKNQKSREVPVSAPTLDALAAYDSRRRAAFGTTATFFVGADGRRVGGDRLSGGFAHLLEVAGVPHVPRGRRPRLGDLRHSFATETLLGWHREGHDVQAMVPRLSTYLGHAGPASTYWYLSAAPELPALAAQRVEWVGMVAT
jgi:integrase/recombinase XerD